MKIGICDDLISEQELIKKYCNHLGYDQIYTYQSGKELLNAKELPDLNLLFLDIEMEEKTGIEVKNVLEIEHPATFIVFCTTHRESMPDAFGRNVINFISKPCSERAVEQSINRAAYLGRDFYRVRLDEKKTVLCKDIMYLHSEQKYTIFYMTDGQTITVRKPIKEWKTDLAPLGFCLISRSSIINMKYYRKTEKRQALLTGNVTLPVSRTCLSKLAEAYDAYILEFMHT